MISSSDKLTSVKHPDSVASPLGGAIPVQIPIDVLTYVITQSLRFQVWSKTLNYE